MPYKCLTYIVLNDEKKSPGDTVTKAELKEAGQTDENVAELIAGGSLSEDMSVDVHPDHVIDDSTVVDRDGGEGSD